MNADSSHTPTPQETFSESAAAGNGRRPTMKQVAAVAGVSLATVSRVVNGGPSVGPDLAERVHRAVELLGYRHNLTASSLRRADRLSASIGLVFEDVGNPFFSAVHRGVEEVARRRGVLTFAGSSDEVPERERELAESFGARGVDGLIIVPAGAAREAVAHLLAAGHRRIGYLGDRPELHTGGERLRGYRQALAAHGIEDDPALVHTSEQRPYDVTRELLLGDDPPTALFTSQNLITIDAVRAIHDLGVQHAVAHVGFDDVPLADVVDPGLTVVAQDPAALGRSAADLLFSRLDGYDGPGRRVVHPTTLIARGSGELPAPARAS
jgi:LacI family transcriptional regulator